jgi:hypothetical protein
MIVELEFTGSNNNLNLICPLGNPTSRFSGDQLLEILKKSYDLPCPMHFSYRASDQRLCLEDPCYSANQVTEALLRERLDRIVRTAQQTFALWDSSRWQNGPAPISPSGPSPAVQPATNVPAGPTTGQTATLANKILVGTESLGGYSRLEFRFGADGKVTMMDRDGSTPGTYTQQGNTIVLSFYQGTVVYTGTYDGQSLTGSARNGQTTWNFSVKS